MIINILDAGLTSRVGHHFDFDRKLFAQLTQAGHQVRLYGFAEMDDDAYGALAAIGPVSRLFRRFPYHGPDQYDSYAAELELILWEAQILAEDLRQVAAADLWLWPSFNVQHLHACALAAGAPPVVGCVHEDPGIASRSISALLWRAGFLAARRRGLRLTVGSVESELCHRFAEIAPDGRFPLFPQPFDGSPSAQPKAALKRIGFFGHQREERGAAVLAPLVERLLGDGYAVTLHDSGPEQAQWRHPRIELLGFVDDLAAPISTCDLVVLPYEIAPYRMKGSGILAQCLASGVPVTGPIGTIPGRIIEQHQVGPLFVTRGTRAVLGAVARANQHYAGYAHNAHRVARMWEKRHGQARYAEALLAAVAAR